MYFRGTLPSPPPSPFVYTYNRYLLRCGLHRGALSRQNDTQAMLKAVADSVVFQADVLKKDMDELKAFARSRLKETNNKVSLAYKGLRQ